MVASPWFISFHAFVHIMRFKFILSDVVHRKLADKIYVAIWEKQLAIIYQRTEHISLPLEFNRTVSRLNTLISVNDSQFLTQVYN
jgi:hypothetical protein